MIADQKNSKGGFKMKKKNLAILFFAAMILFAAMQVNDNDNAEPTQTEGLTTVGEDSDASDETIVTTGSTVSDFILDVSSLGDAYVGDLDITDWEVEHGDLLSVIYSGDGIIVVKTKISPSFSNSATINQNYYNVCDLIENHGFNTCSELQYWAVADMSDGSESKVISFTLDSDTIQNVYDGSIVDNQLGDYVNDLYILPSLQN